MRGAHEVALLVVELRKVRQPPPAAEVTLGVWLRRIVIKSAFMRAILRHAELTLWARCRSARILG